MDIKFSKLISMQKILVLFQYIQTTVTVKGVQKWAWVIRLESCRILAM